MNSERWKYCQAVNTNGDICGKTAHYACDCGEYHLNDPALKGMFKPPTKEECVKHPLFCCEECVGTFED